MFKKGKNKSRNFLSYLSIAPYHCRDSNRGRRLWGRSSPLRTSPRSSCSCRRCSSRCRNTACRWS